MTHSLIPPSRPKLRLLVHQMRRSARNNLRQARRREACADERSKAAR